MKMKTKIRTNHATIKTKKGKPIYLRKLPTLKKYRGRAHRGFPATNNPFNISYPNTRSNRVVVMLLRNIRNRITPYKYDVSFRIDKYQKAYQKKRRPTLYKQMCVFKSKIRLFYGQLTSSKLLRLIKRTRPEHHQAYLYGLMERRLDVILVRANFCRSIFTAQQIVRHGNICVDNEVVRNCYYPIKYYQVVTFRTKELSLQYKYKIFRDIKSNTFQYPNFPYLIISYKLMFLYIKPIIRPRKEISFTGYISHSSLSKY